jgi:hypothetical protein
MLRVSFDDGTVIYHKDDEVSEIENFPPRETPAPGWERTRDYLPEYRRPTPLRMGVLTVGHRVRTANGFAKVKVIERV